METESGQLDVVIGLEDVSPLIQEGFIGSCTYQDKSWLVWLTKSLLGK